MTHDFLLTRRENIYSTYIELSHILTHLLIEDQCLVFGILFLYWKLVDFSMLVLVISEIFVFEEI